ncbi:sodium/bile acid cotransporter-like [Denticeps clupeoides]|uniref:Hepatic sodium/bile acid cotransporter n=1 Tax=Denticeps clupeoides TaxID=299321 RepID=A0AAY4BIJ7_9TELE|nr:sodium/bile acid cotransporter-like [Denticeps clupeoides]XP_028832483.1 sodium/bile acid cotransporter-like [Denticeps clupeoides]
MNHTTIQPIGSYGRNLNFTSSAESVNTTNGLQSSISEAMDHAISGITIIILFITMVSLGCTMEIEKIKAHIRKPKGVAIAAAAQFGIMPLTAFSLGKVFQLGPIEAVTVLICGCCPGGNLSNIFSLALNGDMNLSIVMTTCSTVLALGMMPLLLYLYCQGFSNLENAVPYGGITIALVLTLIPCGIGIALNHWVPRWSKYIIKGGLSILLIATVAIAVMSGITVGTTVWVVLSPELMTAAALMPLIGYILGYVMAAIFRHNEQCRRTIAVETGCQNIQLCSTILKVAFAPEVIGPLYLFPLIYIIFQAGEALLFVFIYRCYQKFKPTAEEKSLYLEVNNGAAVVKAAQV